MTPYVIDGSTFTKYERPAFSGYRGNRASDGCASLLTDYLIGVDGMFITAHHFDQRIANEPCLAPDKGASSDNVPAISAAPTSARLVIVPLISIFIFDSRLYLHKRMPSEKHEHVAESLRLFNLGFLL